MAWSRSGRAKEYGFLLYAMLAAAAYAVAHDHVTATISPEYFLYGKGLAEDPRPFRWAVTLLAVRASVAAGLLGGALLLLANNPRRSGQPPQLTYRALVKLSLIPIATAALFAVISGIINSSAQLGADEALALGVVHYRVWRFVIVWGIHVGSYAGALLGSVATAILVFARRRKLSRPRDLASAPPVMITSRVRRRWLRSLATLLLGYVALCVAARLGYRVLLYPAPHDAPFVPPDGAKLLSIHAEDGALVIAAQFPPIQDHARTVVIFHGNGETIGGRVQLAEDLRSRGLGVVLAEFRGYGLASKSGPPDEAGLYRDAAAILDELERQGIGPERVALMGISLGTGVAAEMAARGRGAALILVSPYTSITAMAAGAVPFLPGGWLCPDRFDTLSKAPRLHLPALVIHGDSDEVVPFAMGQQVAASIPGATLRVVHGGHHNDLFLNAQAELDAAITDAASRSNARDPP
jgi:alpha-beta hydrolase superfamily lysophospholipase